MKAILLAAGLGRRLSSAHEDPKILLAFDGRSLLERHVEHLRHCGVDEVILVTGYRAERIVEALDRLKPSLRVRRVDNRRYRRGSLLSLMAVADILERSRDSLLLMDADVLYDRRVLKTLIDAPGPDALAVDYSQEPDAEAVKVCLKRQGKDWRIVDFHKKIRAPAWDRIGESVGFFKLGPRSGRFLVERGQEYLAQGRDDLWYEETIRDAVIAPDGQGFAVADVTGLAWVEIDTAEDIAHARAKIAPRIDPTNHGGVG